MPTVDEESLTTFAKDIVLALNGSQSTAEAVAASLVGADLRGHHSHGVRNLPDKYYPEIGQGRIAPTAHPEVQETGTLSALVDGQLAFGQVVGRKATDAAVERAAEHGIGVVGLKDVSHIGRVGEWAERAAESGMMFLAFVCNPGSQYVAPAGSADARLSTNPISLGVPSFNALDFPLVLDIATSQVAHGKIREHAAAGSEVPEEWLVSPSGGSLRNPLRFEEQGEGAIMPLGGFTAGYKGFGLSVMSELIGSIISDGFVSGQNDDTWGNTAAFVAIDPTINTSATAIAERVKVFSAYLRETDYSVPISPGVAAVGVEGLLPGEAEYECLQAFRENGIPLPEADTRLLRELTDELGIADAVPPVLRG